MTDHRLPLHETLANLPPEWPEDLFPVVQAKIHQLSEKVVVLDDDPTGTQTVHGTPVLTEWSVESLAEEFLNDLPAVYLLTNSRSLLLPEAQAMNKKIGRNLLQASRETNRRFAVISRSDSTLRGHFPGEVTALAEALEKAFDAWFIIPFFLEGGRYTLADIHYVADGDWLVPAGETPYAQDATFGYQSSNLRQWVVEKSGGQIASENVQSISIEDIRVGGPARVTERLMSMARGTICIVNAASYQDLIVFTLGMLQAQASGRSYLFRTAASIVPVRSGIPSRPLLTATDLTLPSEGGALFVVGSYVPKTTAQVAKLLTHPDVVGLEIDVRALLEEGSRELEIQRVADEASLLLGRRQDVAIYTSRKLVTGGDAEESLGIGQQVSAALIRIVRAIKIRPRYLLAKGGITSSDVATKGLQVRRAMVLGQILPGVPVWQTGPESRYPGLVYIVFPGNVGGEAALADIHDSLSRPD